MQPCTLVLIEAGEGYTDHVYCVTSTASMAGADLQPLLTLIATTATALVAADRQVRPEWDEWCQWHARRATALVALLSALEPVHPGRYEFPSGPEWLFGAWTLIIAVGDCAYVEEGQRVAVAGDTNTFVPR